MTLCTTVRPVPFDPSPPHLPPCAHPSLADIDVACNLLEVCGRFLYKLPETHVRMQNLLELMMRRKNMKPLDARLDMMVENAFYQCKPPERSAKAVAKLRPPLREYVRHLLYSLLQKATAKQVLRQLRKLPWDADNEAYVLKCLLKGAALRYNHIHLVASVVAGLSAYHDALGLKLTDLLLERVRAHMDDNDYNFFQRRLLDVKFLGELYNYCLFESQLVFDTLYMLINGMNAHRTLHFPPRASHCSHVQTARGATRHRTTSEFGWCARCWTRAACTLTAGRRASGSTASSCSSSATC